MAMWSDVELLINEDSNTVRLDSVSKEENGSGLYQLDTLVKISSASQVISASWTCSLECLLLSLDINAQGRS